VTNVLNCDTTVNPEADTLYSTLGSVGFSILNYIDKLTPAKGKDRYDCPVCGGNNLTVNPKNGKYKCWNGCDCKDIREAIAPFPKPEPKAMRPKSDRTWAYKDREGKPLIRVRRTDDGKGGRQIWQEYFTSGKWTAKGLSDDDKAVMQSAIAPYRYAECLAAIAKGETVLWVEGEPCADALWDLGIPATTTIGGSAGYSSYGDYSEDYKGADLAICPDRDLTGLKYAEAIAEDYPDSRWLYAFPESPLWDRLSKEGGLDIGDWISDGATRDQILGAIEGRRDLRAFEPKKPQQSFEGTDLRKLGSYCKEELVRRNFEAVTGQPIEDWICVGGNLHAWTGSHYEPVEDGVVLKAIQRWMRGLYQLKAGEVIKNPDGSYIVGDDGKPKRNFYPVYPYGGDRQAKGAMETVKTACHISFKKIPRSGINLKNGTLLTEFVLGVPQFKFVPHDRSRYYLYTSDVEWSENADTAYAKQLLGAVDSSQLESFLRHQSMFLAYPETLKKVGRPRAGICEGEGSNGKDAIRRTIEHLFSKIGNFGFAEFKAYDEGRRFNLSALPNFQYSWASENSHKIKLENLKSLMTTIAATDPLWQERKGKDAEPFYPQVPVWFSLNKAPMVDGSAEFIKSRFAVYKFDKVFSNNPLPGQVQADPRFVYDEDFRIKEVCPGLLLLLTQAFQRLWAEGIDWKPCEGRLQEWAIEHNHLLQFSNDLNLSANPAGIMPLSKLYDSLQDWYIVNEFAETDGYGKRLWREAPSQFDPLVKRQNDLFRRLKELFPRIERCIDTDGSVTGGKGRVYVRGLSIAAIDTAPAAAEFEPSESGIQDGAIATDTQLSLSPAPAQPLEPGDRVWYDGQLWKVSGVRRDGRIDLDHATLLKATSANPSDIEKR
jgi:putative DNA primase/helicase